MRKLLLLLLAVALILLVASVSFASEAQTVNGWISDSKCGVKGANAGAEACTKKCIAAGASPVVVTDKDQKVLTVDNPDALKEHYGHHVAVTSRVNESNKCKRAALVAARCFARWSDGRLARQPRISIFTIHF